MSAHLPPPQNQLRIPKVNLVFGQRPLPFDSNQLRGRGALGSRREDKLGENSTVLKRLLIWCLFVHCLLK